MEQSYPVNLFGWSFQLEVCFRRQLYEVSALRSHDALAVSLALQTSIYNCLRVVAFKKKSRCPCNGCCAKLRYRPLNNYIRLRKIAQLPVKGLMYSSIVFS